MNEKTNPWMLSTAVLIGLIIGFTIGRVIPNISPVDSKNVAANTLNAQNAANPTAAAPTAPAAQQEPQFAEINIDYSTATIGKTTDGNWTLGDKKAKITLEEYSDFQCPYCHSYSATTFPQLYKDYIATGKVYYIYRNFPLSFHPQAQKAAEAAACAGEQNKFWEMHDALFNNQNAWSSQTETYLQTFQGFAQKLGLDMTKFNQCVNNDQFSALIKKDLAAGNKKGITGTPTFLVNGENEIVGAQEYSKFQEALNLKTK
ncbi:MAG: thioredoxin domain-containing protein [Candidatus Gracilibacteria bacterium]|jgi:protein-disulfide isomerase